ncbi:hypothetical protein [Krasilnikovia cinnamomea]|uniref:hypothetical protein n=1 Tax=Krasilnikovia cinnamomea TaxID=349313 RepID=UPI00102B0857|nr:hypothetical protein [Krasilnikovia cinnamomea]
MNKLRVGALLALTSLPWALAATVAAAAGAPAWTVVTILVLAEVSFWIGVLLMGRATYQAARARGWRAVPGELWWMLRTGRSRTEAVRSGDPQAL